MLRTHTCGELTSKEEGSQATLSGWVFRRRDHGGLIFIDLRDHYGVTQLTFDPGVSKDAWELASSLRSEFVVRATGKVLKRPDDMVNPKMTTGAIEVEVEKLEILNEAKTPPFEIAEDKEVNEEMRLKYRFLDLRNPRLQNILRNKDAVMTYVRKFFHDRHFTEVQTPILANSSPEGARDFIVPSRLHPGKFYALPQAPQQFKQLLMVGGMDRYFQIAPCFRDEDPRADRHPGEFYQIDVEMSFVEQEDVWQTIEPLMIDLTEKFSDKTVLQKPFPRMTYLEAMNAYGSDKPDLRFEFKMMDVSDVFVASEFTVFRDALGKTGRSRRSRGVVYALPISGATFSRKDIDDLTDVAKRNGAKGLAYIHVDTELRSPILKFLSKTEQDALIQKTGAKKGDILFFGADSWDVVTKSLGAVRNACGERLGLKDPKKAAWVWVHDFPMYDYSELEDGKIDFSHNPFSMPQGGMLALNEQDPLDILAYQYDLACNGYEISSGAIRNHQPDVMYRAFEIAGYSRVDVDAKFGHMIRAFEYGAPPHGGLAPGVDRLLMVLWELPSIRDMYAFPKSGQALDVMLGAPSEVTPQQLRDVHIQIAKRADAKR